MSNAQIVVDLTFGDGGKGITVANLCNNGKKNLVIRFSGGPNAGHAVIHNGIKHTFSSFGSGTLQGQDSYFSEHTSMYLPNLCREYEELMSKGVVPVLYLNPLVTVITPRDVAYHRLMESINKHSSTGIGHGQAMKRNESTPYKLYAIDFNYPEFFSQKMRYINNYYDNKVEELNDQTLLHKYLKILRDANNDYCHYYNKYKNNFPFKVSPLNDIVENYENYIFEGSQGILLDMNHGNFPYVTYANTTSKNALEIVNNTFDIIYPEIYYVTRCYQTRHGNGWMSNNIKVDLVNNQEEINVYNKFQGEFRISEFDYKLIDHAINIDNIYSNGLIKNLVVTCLDQRPDFKLVPSFLNENIIEVYFNSSPSTGNMKLQKNFVAI